MITTSLETALLILTIEFAFLAAAIAFFSYRGARTAEAETVADASELVSKVSNTEDSRRVALETVFKEKYQYEGDDLDEAVEEFMQREKAFYNAVVGAFLGRGKNKISDLSDELTKVVAPWISITPKKMLDVDSAESLVAEKSQLETELGETKQVLEKMISEYNRAFKIEAGEQAAPDPAASASMDDEMAEFDDIDDDLPGVEGVEDGAQENDAAPADSVVPAAGIDLSDDPDLNMAMIDELDDEAGVDPPAETPLERAEKPMTADDLDDLMQSLESEPLDDVETA
jgi:hypothetical protein